MIGPDEPLETMLEVDGYPSAESVLARFLEAAITDIEGWGELEDNPTTALLAGLRAVLVADGPTPEEVLDELYRRAMRGAGR